MSDATARINILHVDDEPDFAEMAAEFLVRLDDRVAVQTARSASDGLALISKATPDCVISDYEMPGRDGIEFLEAVRESYPDLPFILFTGKGSEEIASEAISAGVTDYLQKRPGSSQYEVLANRVRNAVSQFRTRRELDRSQNLLEHTEQLADVGGWEADIETGAVRWTDGTYAIHDLDADSDFEPTVETALAFYHPDDRAAIEQVVEQSVETGEPYDVELRLVTADDRLRWVRTTGMAVRTDGDVVSIRGAIQDITERKGRERELQERNQQLQAVLDNVEVAIWIRDRDSRFVVINQNFRDLFGLADDTTVVGKRPSELFSDELASQFRENDEQVLETEASAEIQEQVTTARGVRTYLTRITPLFDDDALYATCGVASDITPQHVIDRR